MLIVGSPIEPCLTSAAGRRGDDGAVPDRGCTGATHLFEEPGTLEQVAVLARKVVHQPPHPNSGGTLMREDVLVSAEELLKMPQMPAPAILDVRWRLDQPDGQAAYVAGHIPGAVYVSLEDELSDHSRPGLGTPPAAVGRRSAGRRPSLGLSNHRPVVVYDDWNRAGVVAGVVGTGFGGSGRADP